MSTDWQVTQLKAEKLQAIIRRDWKEVNRLEQRIKEIESKADLVNQLWPGAKVRG